MPFHYFHFRDRSLWRPNTEHSFHFCEFLVDQAMRATSHQYNAMHGALEFWVPIIERIIQHGTCRIKLPGFERSIPNIVIDAQLHFDISSYPRLPLIDLAYLQQPLLTERDIHTSDIQQLRRGMVISRILLRFRDPGAVVLDLDDGGDHRCKVTQLGAKLELGAIVDVEEEEDFPFLREAESVVC